MKVADNHTAIITYVDRNNEENLERDFLPSLFFNAEYAGLVYVLDYGMDSEVVNRLSDKYPVHFIECSIETDIFVDRYKNISSIIESLPS